MANDPELDGFVSKRSIGPLFDALAEKCANSVNGIVAMIRPTVVFTGPVALHMRRVFSKRFHIHTLLTSHQPGNVNLSQNAGINESLIIARRFDPKEGTKPPTRIISLDRMPTDDQAVAELYDHLVRSERGLLSDGWGEISEWPVERIEAGDWTAGVFRAPELAEAAFDLANHKSLLRMEDQNMVPSAVLSGGAQMREFGQADVDASGTVCCEDQKEDSCCNSNLVMPMTCRRLKRRPSRRRLPGGRGPLSSDSFRGRGEKAAV